MDERESRTVSAARANITEVIARVRLLRRCIFLTNRSKPVAAIVPAELGELVCQAGGIDSAIALLRRHLEPGTPDVGK